MKNANKFGIGYYHMQPGLGFGYDFAILEDPLKLGSTAGKGTFLWDGIAGTWFWIDPSNDVIFVGMIQRWLLTRRARCREFDARFDLSGARRSEEVMQPGIK